MSNEDFQQRLQRLQSQASHHHAIHAGQPVQTMHKTSRPKALRVGIGGGIMGLGGYLIRYANQNYEALRDSGGLGMIATYGLGGLALAVLGIVLMMRAVFAKTAPASVSAPRPKRRASATAIWVTSTFGFLAGVTSCFYLFLWATLRFIGTEKALSYEHGSLGVAVLLCLITLCFGVLSLFLRGRSLGRVFVYYWCGAVLTFAVFILADINMLKWQPLMEHLK